MATDCSLHVEVDLQTTAAPHSHRQFYPRETARNEVVKGMVRGDGKTQLTAPSCLSELTHCHKAPVRTCLPWLQTVCGQTTATVGKPSCRCAAKKVTGGLVLHPFCAPTMNAPQPLPESCSLMQHQVRQHASAKAPYHLTAALPTVTRGTQPSVATIKTEHQCLMLYTLPPLFTPLLSTCGSYGPMDQARSPPN